MEMPQQGMPVAPPQAEEAPEKAGTSIEVMVGDDGSLTISMEAGDVEGAEDQEVPAKDKNDALRIVGQMIDALQSNSAQAPGSPQAQEDAAYQTEMAA